MKFIFKTSQSIFLAFILISCTKQAAIPENGILGVWNLVTDSTFSGVGIANHAVNYRGKRGDYFDFRTDGTLYIRENSISNKVSYTILSDSTMIIGSFGITVNGVPATCFISRLTVHYVEINAPIFVTPGGIFGRKVTLSR